MNGEIGAHELSFGVKPDADAELEATINGKATNKGDDDAGSG